MPVNSDLGTPTDALPAADDAIAPTVPLPPTIAAQISALELVCRFRQIKVRQASRMRDVVQLQMLDIRGELVGYTNEIRGYKQLSMAAEARLRELMCGHLVELRAQKDLQNFIQLRSHFLHREWANLKASYPLIFREADGESDRLQRRLEREIDLQRKRMGS